jgi:hypothetical protein
MVLGTNADDVYCKMQDEGNMMMNIPQVDLLLLIFVIRHIGFFLGGINVFFCRWMK